MKQSQNSALLLKLARRATRVKMAWPGRWNWQVICKPHRRMPRWWRGPLDETDKFYVQHVAARHDIVSVSGHMAVVMKRSDDLYPRKSERELMPAFWKKRRSKTHKIKRTPFNGTKQDKTCKWSRKSSFWSHVQHKNKQLINVSYVS